MTIARLALILPALALAACQTTMTDPTPTPAPRTPGATVGATAGDAAAAAAAEARTGTIPDTLTVGTLQRPAGSRSVAQLDASAAEKAAATAPAAKGGRLGTPLVKAAGKGRIVNPANGKSVNVDLIPLGGPASAGSQVSLPALTTLGIGLTDLPTVEVFSA